MVERHVPLARVLCVLAACFAGVAAGGGGEKTLEPFMPMEKIAVYSVADAGYQNKTATALLSKQCYALQHGYQFVLDVIPYVSHNR